MNYEPNKIRWKPGDIVIHDADQKSPYMLMMVVGYLKDGRCETRYLNPRTTTMQRRYANRLDVLHDPKRFGIDVDHVPISALTDICNWQAKIGVLKTPVRERVEELRDYQRKLIEGPPVKDLLQ